MFHNIFGKTKSRNRAEKGFPSIPEKNRVYVVGDIHGKYDLLKSVHNVILHDSKTLPSGYRRYVVYLGDYIDRGYESKQVLDLLIEAPLKEFSAVFLKGNHEAMMLEFLLDFSVGSMWIPLGGDATLHSYGISVPLGQKCDKDYVLLQEMLRNKLSEAHKLFLKNLKLYYEMGDYAFVHAGIMPGKRLAKQHPEHLLWIREEFLESTDDHGKIIVHGHTVTDKPVVLKNRIGLDTGAYFTGQLTCMVLEGGTKRFLTN